MDYPPAYFWISLIITLLAYLRHRDNIKRLLPQGKEPARRRREMTEGDDEHESGGVGSRQLERDRLASLLADNGFAVAIYARNPSVAEEINRRRTNAKYLPEFHLPPGVSATTSLGGGRFRQGADSGRDSFTLGRKWPVGGSLSG